MTRAERRLAQRDARNDLQLLSQRRRTLVLQNKDAGQYRDPIIDARQNALALKQILAVEPLEDG